MIGVAGDPYQPAEEHYRVTRSILEVLRRAEGMELCILTKSPLILRDLDLLTELDARHSVRVRVALTAADSFLSKRIERHAPDPQSRLEAVEALAQEGIHTEVVVDPLMPGINDSAAVLRPLVEGARLAGAADVAVRTLKLRASERAAFLPWLERELPGLVGRYRRLYSWRESLAGSQKELVETAFRQLRLTYGFPRSGVARG